MHKRLAPFLLPAVLACRSVPLPPETPEESKARVSAALDALHSAAARADGVYFSLFAPEAVFYGTDASERWTLEEFRAYAEPIFARGQGWTYVSTERHVFLDADGDTAWFDERLENKKYGEVRGSGVLVLREGAWLVAQYNLAFPVPNTLATDLVERIRSLGVKPLEETPGSP
jgi:hypothetical protein